MVPIQVPFPFIDKCSTSDIASSCSQVMPKPVLELLSFSFPLVSSDLGAADLENELLMNQFNLSKVLLVHFPLG